MVPYSNLVIRYLYVIYTCSICVSIKTGFNHDFLDWIILCYGDFAVLCTIECFVNILAAVPVAPPTPFQAVTIRNVSRHCRMFLQGQNHPWLTITVLKKFLLRNWLSLLVERDC